MIVINHYREFKSADVPSKTGVYLYKNAQGDVIYCGKAKNLRARVKSYFSSQHLLPLKTRRLVTQIRQIEWIIVDNEVDALLLENRLIKQYQPKYNIALKDAKTFAYIALSKEAFPRIFTTRKPTPNMAVFGAYTDGHLRVALQKMVIELFQLRDCKTLPKKACLNFHIQRCTAPCIGRVNEHDYAKQVAQARQLLEGNVKDTLHFLATQMHHAAQSQHFEQALVLRNQMQRLQQLEQKQIIDAQNTQNQDVIAFERQGEQLYIARFTLKRGVLSGKQTFCVDYQLRVKQTFVMAFYQTHTLPHEIIVNQAIWDDEAEKTSLETVLTQRRGGKVVLTLPLRGNKLALVKLAEKNTESAVDHDSALFDLQRALNLARLPRVIECFDISNLGNEHIVSGMTQFIDMKANKNGFRHFALKTLTHADDFASMREVVTRRYQRLLEEHKTLPDLIVIDGGLGQVNAAFAALNALEVCIPLIGLAKKQEEIYLPCNPSPLIFNQNTRMMLLLRRIRDATHDFSVSYNRKKRAMKLRDECEKQH